MITYLTDFFLDLRLKYKMVILTTLVLLSFSVGGLSILQYAFNLYNQEIYRQSAQALQVSMNSMESELRKMEQLSYQIATDRYVQSYLLDINNTESHYYKFLFGSELRRHLLQIGALNKYVQSIQVYDTSDNEYASGNMTVRLSEERREALKEAANEAEGGISWVSPSEEDESVTAVRGIREYINFSLENLGTMGIRVNIRQMMDELTNNMEAQGTNFLIFDKQEYQLFASENFFEDFKPSSYMEGKQGYQIISYQGEKYFFTYSESEADHLDWTYVIITPYSSLFTVITKARTAVFLTYSILFILVVFLGVKFTGTIVNPIESLNKKMKKVQTGDFNYEDVGMEVRTSKDEAGQMHENFKKMMQQINDLIIENYKKQLLIKESEFETLQAQVHPHFLYNTLESINWSAQMAGEKKIAQMAESLGYVLRASINTKEALISLKEELAIVDHYITIQRYRFEERLQFSKDIEEKYLTVMVPKFIIQPLIENSIKYGLQEIIGPCAVTLSVREEEQQIIITIADNGPGMNPDYIREIEQGEYTAKGTGIGIRNINERIRMLFGEEYGLKIESIIHQGTVVSIRLPRKDGTM
ncbi:cache domain-containing sensor histidine kinase [Gracilibacillus alcaliphilus]|uniref:cache domain-containing sensor histidine kinase n=1 Tax=Gracilibacillus alcaliphilus TaxID=1401441 RepID=UPI00195DA9AE|nr:sensor histidine kinase [Gracilibacillus alcaliphilus]MBM7675947.1 two-component system sensor histidine kinase YesM [Gracilibacillus alcaliphilus]